MWIRIVDIDRAISAISLVIAPRNTEESFAKVDAFVSKCRNRGFDDVRIVYHPGMSRSVVRKLKNFCSLAGLKDPEIFRVDRDSREDASGFWSHQHSQAPPGTADIEYQICIDDLDNATDKLDTAVMLISESLDLDPRSHFRLRLCVYELATNTVEHGNFKTDYPGICVCFVFSKNQVQASYADNASVFVNESTANVNLAEKQIKSRSKRGLGLYMITGICDDWQYQRVEAWNVTKFSLKIGRVETALKER